MKVILSVLFVSISFIISAQQRDQIDSLNLLLNNTAIADTTAIDIYNLLCKAYSPYNSDTSYSYGTKALHLSQKIKDSEREAWSMNRLGIVYDYKGGLDSALLWFRKSYNLYAQLGDTSRMADVFINMGVCYHYGTMYDSALSYYIRATELKEKIGSESKLEYAFNNIGLIFRMQKNYHRAISYYQKSLALKQKINDKPGIITTMGNLASLYQSLNSYDSSEVLIIESLHMAEALGDTSLIAWNYVNLGQNFFYKKNYNEALKYQLIAKQDLSGFLEKRDLLLNSFCLAEIYRNLENSKQAEYYFHESEKQAKELGMMETLVNVYAGLSTLYEDQSIYQTSLIFHKKYDSLSNLMFNKEKTSIVEELEKKYQSELKENAIAALEISQQKSVNERNVFILLASIVILVSVFLYLLLRSKSKSNKIITKSLDEKDTLLKEIHHRVKNNLQIISSLLSLQSRYIKDDVAIKAVTESKNRVKSMALIHQKLYQKDNLIGIDMVDYIENLSDALYNSYGIKKNESSWQLECNSLRLDIDTTIPLGLIINELVSNSLKHAFNEAEQTKLMVSLQVINDILVLKVQDTGHGFNLEKAVKRESFGLNLIDTLAQKLKGQMTMDSSDGAVFTLEIKKFKII